MPCKPFILNKQESPLEMYKTVPVWKREPVRVLSLFGDIKKGEHSEVQRTHTEKMGVPGARLQASRLLSIWAIPCVRGAAQ